MKRKDHKKIIGLILENIFSDFSKELIQSISDAIRLDQNIRLIVLAGRYDGNEVLVDENYHNYLKMYNSVFMLDQVCDFDGLMIHLGSMTDEKKKLIYSHRMEHDNGTPRVFIASENREGETMVNYDNESGIREAVDYLVNVNGLSKFCMLGGREDNMDACDRKDIFIRCLKENRIEFLDENYEKTDMSEECEEEAGRLLDNNPDVQAIFCVNDATAKGLYAAMYARNITPGKEILVFGFDNTYLSGEMLPPLSSIGADNCTLGKKALEVLLRKMNGEDVQSELVPTRLYGRESFYYEMYNYSELELVHKSTTAFIERIFDDCFYRYRNSYIDRESVNLKRLFYEIISRMLAAMNKRYMSIENFNEITRMIDTLFEKGAMNYTDASKLLRSIERLQSNINIKQKSIAANQMLNRLFLRMKDKAIMAISEQKIKESAAYIKSIRMEQEFLMSVMFNDDSLEKILGNIGKLGLKNCAVYLFDSPFQFHFQEPEAFPESIHLGCVMKGGEMYFSGMQKCLVSEIFSRKELSLKCKGYVAFTLFYGEMIYGFLLCEVTEEIYHKGDYLALQLSKAIYMNELKKYQKTE